MRQNWKQQNERRKKSNLCGTRLLGALVHPLKPQIGQNGIDALVGGGSPTSILTFFLLQAS
jgi:hypothetical protein